MPAGKVAESRIFERIVAVTGLGAALMAAATLLIGVGLVGASLDMLADPIPMLKFAPQQVAARHGRAA
jgi:hypothetical protein